MRSLLLLLLFPVCAWSAPNLAIVMQDQVALRSAAKSSAKPNAVLWAGETVEVRGERLDHLLVYDYRRERGGFVHASQVQRLSLAAAEGPTLLAVLRFLRSQPGKEALGIGYAAAFIEAASAETMNGEAGIEALDALGTLADRLAQRASSRSTPKAEQATLDAHLGVASRYGVRFVTYEHDGRMHVCYDGAAFRRVLAMKSTHEQRARAAIALTRAECMAGEISSLERRKLDEWRGEVLEMVDEAALLGWLRNRVLMRRAIIWSGLGYQRARQDGDAAAAAGRSLKAIGAIAKAELRDEDRALYAEAAMRVNASRWAAAPARTPDDRRLRVVLDEGAPGETCVRLLDAKRDLARRCTYGVAWIASATINREATALALAVQPTPTWRELWLFHKSGNTWAVRVLPPGEIAPGVGYAEFAGWVPGGSQVLVAREALGEGKYKRSFELVRLDTLAPVRQSTEPTQLAALRKWQDPSWKRDTLSLR